MFISDKPINCPEDDTLNRIEFSENLAQTIIEWGQTDSIVLAINGKWGYGKTSLLNLVKHYINIKTKESSNLLSKLSRMFIKLDIEEVDKKIVIVDYCPWGFDDQDKIHNALFKDIAKAINKHGFFLLEVASKISEYSKALRNKLYLPFDIFAKGILTLGTMIVVLLFKLSNSIIFWLALSVFVLFFVMSLVSIISSSRSPIELKKRLSEMILRKRLRMIVFIDDIDRLSRDEILMLLKVIRVNADFPNCIYVLALDYEVVSNIIGSQEYGICGYDYLNKIIQVNISLPAHDPELIRQYIIHDLEKFFDLHGIKSVNKQFEEGAQHWYHIQEAGIWSMISSLREAKRYLNSVKYLLLLLTNTDILEVNALDLLSIEAIRLYDPVSYEYVKYNEELFCNTKMIFEDEKKAIERHTDIYNKWIHTIDANKATKVLGMLHVLFPQLKDYNPSILGYIESDERDSVRTLRINTKEHFAKYFSFNFKKTGDCIAQLDIETLTSSRDYDKLKDIIMKHIGANSLTQLLFRLTNEITEDTLKSKSFVTLLQVLFDVSDNVSYDYQGVFSNQEYDTLYYSSLNIIQWLGKAVADKVVPSLVEQSESLYAPVRLLNTILNSDKSDPFCQPIVSNSVISRVKMAVIRLIEDRKENLLEHPQFSFIYDCWFEWSDDKSTVTKYRNGLYQDVTHLVLVLDKIQNKVHSSNRAEPIRYFDLFAKSSTHDIELMHSKVLDIVNQHEEIYNVNKKMIDRFLSNYEDFKQGKKVDWSNIKE